MAAYGAAGRTSSMRRTGRMTHGQRRPTRGHCERARRQRLDGLPETSLLSTMKINAKRKMEVATTADNESPPPPAPGGEAAGGRMEERAARGRSQ